jgi:hypothetical protein
MKAKTGDDQPWVIGPLGEKLTLDMLPKPGMKRWLIRHKAELVAAVEGRLLSLNELLRHYRITPSEYEHWKDAVRKFGMAGLRSTRARDYRELERRFPDLERPAPRRKD